jgi:hypothetical protein
MGTLLVGAAPHRRSLAVAARMKRGRKAERPVFWQNADQPPPNPRRRKRRKGKR